jgi:hypothetical protein
MASASRMAALEKLHAKSRASMTNKPVLANGETVPGPAPFADLLREGTPQGKGAGARGGAGGAVGGRNGLSAFSNLSPRKPKGAKIARGAKGDAVPPTMVRTKPARRLGDRHRS